MIVQNLMKTNVITITPDTSIEKAMNIMKTHRIRHLPVLDSSSHLVGIVSDRDLRGVSRSALLERRSIAYSENVETIMSTNLITGTPLDFVEDIAALFHEFKIGSMPILQSGKLVGIVTETDLLFTFVQITGAHMPSSRFEIKIRDRLGTLSKVLDVFQRKSINIISVLLYPSDEENVKNLVIRAGIMNTNSLIDELQKEGFDVVWPKKL